MFRRGVGWNSQATLEGKERGVVDNGPLAASHRVGVKGEHVSADIAAERKDSVEVDLDHLRFVSNFTTVPQLAFGGLYGFAPR